jgi:ElaB/YqjD/DUF883 family membrane-anchored ribosome-binding protein
VFVPDEFRALPVFFLISSPNVGILTSRGSIQLRRGVKTLPDDRNHLRVQLLDAIARISDRGDVTMNKDNFEGTVRSVVGQGEKIVGQVTNDRSTTAQGYYDDAAGKARSAVGSAKDAVSGGVDAISSLDFSELRDEITKLTQKVSDLAQNQVAAGRDRVVGAMGAAGETLSESSANAQDKFAALEGDLESRIKKNPWGAVAVAGLIGLLIGKMS